MRKLQRFTALASCLGLAVACSSSPEPIKQNPALMDPDAKAGYDPTAEEKRLRDMMAVRVVDEDGKVEQWDAVGTVFNGAISEYCAPKLQACQGTTNRCDLYAECEAADAICRNEVRLAIAEGEAEVILTHNGEQYRVPRQSSATIAALAGSVVANGIHTAANDVLGNLAGDGDCGDAELTSPRLLGDETRAEYLPSALVQLYYQGIKAFELASKATIAVADSQRGSTPSRLLALARMMSGKDLSRTAAAHLLAGGAPGLEGSVGVAMCSSTRLDPRGRQALSILRQSGVDPRLVLAMPDSDYLARYGLSPVATEVLLNTAPGSVRIQLAALNGVSLAGTVQNHFDLSTEDFVVAREFLAEEIVAYRRDLDALVNDTAGTTRFAATATEPPKRPDAFYGAIARTNDIDASGRPTLIWNQGAAYDRGPANLANHLGWFRRAAGRLVNDAVLGAKPYAANILGTMELILTSREVDGEIATCLDTNDLPTVTLEGFKITDGAAIVRGERALSCAISGTDEGKTPCSPSTVSDNIARFDQSAPAPLGYDSAVKSGEPASFWEVEDRYYLVVPRHAGDTVGLGNARVLTGFVPYRTNPPSSTLRCSYVVVAPQVERALADALAPSPVSCAEPRVDCAGGMFNQRLPLEDELASDGDNVESSWKYYLGKAREAAAESDRLGEEYAASILGSEQRAEDDDLRRFAREQAVAAELQELQNICGTSADPTKLLKHLLGLNPDGTTHNQQIDRGPCTNPMPEHTTCFGGRAVADWRLLVFSGDLETFKLGKCLAEFDDVEEYVHFGDSKLCAWEDANGHLCGGAAPGQKCPDLGVECEPPPNATIKILDKYLSFFSTPKTLPPDPVPQLCEGVRRVRGGADPEEAIYQFRQTNLFDPITLKGVANSINLTVDVGGYVTLRVGEHTYSTGTAGGGPNAGSWPCKSTEPGDPPTTRRECEDGGDGLFCQEWDCTQPTERSEANQRLYTAGVAAIIATWGGTNHPVVDTPVLIHHGWKPSDAVGSSLNAWNGEGAPKLPLEVRTNDLWRVFRSAGQTAFIPHTLPIPRPDVNGDTWFLTESSGGDAFAIHRTSLRSRSKDLVSKIWKGLSNTVQSDGYFVNVLRKTTDTSLPSPLLDMDRIIDTGDYQVEADSFYDEGSPDGAEKGGNHLPPSARGWRHLDARLLRGGNKPDESVPYRYYEGSSLKIEPTDTETMLDGLEVVCDLVANSKSTAGCDPSNPPTLQTLNDLDNVGSHLQCVGDSITRSVVLSLLRDLPTAALTPLVDSGSKATGGEMGAAVSLLRTDLLTVASSGPILGSTVRLFGEDMKQLKSTMKRFELKDEMSAVQMDLAQFDAATNCVAGAAGGMSTTASFAPGTGVSTASFFSPASAIQGAISCAAGLARLSFVDKLNDLSSKDTEQERAIAISDFNQRFTTHLTTLDSEEIKLTQSVEGVARALQSIESLKQRARRHFNKAIWLSSQQSEHSALVDVGFQRREETARLRYVRAHTNAKRMAFLARRAIEQRIGTSLGDMTTDLPLVEAPVTWADGVCATSGIDPDVVVGANGNLTPNFADSYIGEYVRKLENVVESYRLENGFHEGSDTTIISLRDDVMAIRTECNVPSKNLIAEPLDFDRPATAFNPDSAWSWYLEGCTFEDEFDSEGNLAGRTATNCISAVPDPQLSADFAPANSPLPRAKLTRNVLGTRLTFGSSGCQTAAECGFDPHTRLVTRVTLPAGPYRYSWYTRSSNPALGYVKTLDGESVEVGRRSLPTGEGTWARDYMVFRLAESTELEVGFGYVPGSFSEDELTVAAPQLEQIVYVPPDAEILNTAPEEFELPDESGNVVSKSCVDQFGESFRNVAWQRGCSKLCSGGFDTDCSPDAKDYCYWETSFNVSQRAWENGDMFGLGGFARGNFNYRIDDVAVNFVGDVRDCSGSEVPDTCYSNAYVPYSLYHRGPFFVRNHAGADFEAMIFDGNIEHARGLGAGRYLGNPLSSGDQQLITPYIRQEFRGRPLDGTFVLRVWDEQGVDFKKLEDVQLMLNYRYWTRNN